MGYVTSWISPRSILRNNFNAPGLEPRSVQSLSANFSRGLLNQAYM
jgi:hypothetical protein